MKKYENLPLFDLLDSQRHDSEFKLKVLIEGQENKGNKLEINIKLTQELKNVRNDLKVVRLEDIQNYASEISDKELTGYQALIGLETENQNNFFPQSLFLVDPKFLSIRQDFEKSQDVQEAPIQLSDQRKLQQCQEKKSISQSKYTLQVGEKAEIALDFIALSGAECLTDFLINVVQVEGSSEVEAPNFLVFDQAFGDESILIAPYSTENRGDYIFKISAKRQDTQFEVFTLTFSVKVLGSEFPQLENALGSLEFYGGYDNSIRLGKVKNTGVFEYNLKEPSRGQLGYQQNPTYATFSQQSLTFNLSPERTENEYSARLYLNFNMQNKEFAGSYFGIPSSSATGDFDNDFVIQIKVLPLREGLTLTQSNTLDKSGLVVLQFSEPASFDTFLSPSDIFSALFSFSIDTKKTSDYLFETHLESLTSSEVRFKIEPTKKDFSDGMELIVKIAQNLSFEQQGLVVSQNKENGYYLQAQQLKVELVEGILICEEDNQLASESISLTIGQREVVSLPLFVSLIDSLCYSEYTLSFSTQKDGQTIENPSFLTLRDNKLYVQPLTEEHKGSYSVSLTVQYTDSVQIQRQITIQVGDSEFLSFASELPNPHVIERSFLTAANTYQLPQILNPKFLNFNLKLTRGPSFASLNGNTVNFQIPLGEEQTYQLTFEWNAESAAYTGSYFGVPFTQGFDVSPYSQEFDFFVKVKDTSQPAINLVRSQTEVGQWGLVEFEFSKPVSSVDTSLQSQTIFEQQFDFEIEGLTLNQDFEIIYELLDSSNLYFTVLNLQNGFTEGQILKIITKGKEADGALLVAKEEGVLEYLGEKTYEVTLQAGLIKCFEVTEFSLITKIALGEIREVDLPQFKSIAGTSCSTDYTLSLSLKEGGALYGFITYEQPSGESQNGKLVFSPQMAAETGTFDLILTVTFSSEVVYSSELQVSVYQSGLPFFKEDIRKIQIFELYQDQSFSLPTISNIDAYQYNIQAEILPSFASFSSQKLRFDFQAASPGTYDIQLNWNLEKQEYVGTYFGIGGTKSKADSFNQIINLQVEVQSVQASILLSYESGDDKTLKFSFSESVKFQTDLSNWNIETQLKSENDYEVGLKISSYSSSSLVIDYDLNYRRYSEGDTLSLVFPENKQVLSQDLSNPSYLQQSTIEIPIGEISDDIACLDNVNFLQTFISVSQGTRDSITIPEFQIFNEQTQSCIRDFTTTLTYLETEILPPFMRREENTISIAPHSLKDEGRYTLVLSTSWTQNDEGKSENWTIILEIKGSLYPSFKEEFYSLSYNILYSEVFQIPSVNNKGGYDYELELISGPSFVKHSTGSRIIEIYPDSEQYIGSYVLEFSFKAETEGYSGSFFGLLNNNQGEPFNQQILVDLEITQLPTDNLSLDLFNLTERNQVQLEFKPVQAIQIEQDWDKIVEDLFTFEVVKNKRKKVDYQLYGEMEYLGPEGLTFRLKSPNTNFSNSEQVEITLRENAYFIAASGDQSRLAANTYTVSMYNVEKIQLDPSECRNITSIPFTRFFVKNGERLQLAIQPFQALVADRTECFTDFTYSLKHQSFETLPHFILFEKGSFLIDVMPHSEPDIGTHVLTLDIQSTQHGLLYEISITITVEQSLYPSFRAEIEPLELQIYETKEFTLPAITNTARFQYEIQPRDELPGFITWDSFTGTLKVDSLSFLEQRQQQGRRLQEEETEYFYNEPVWMQWTLISNGIENTQLAEITGLSTFLSTEDFNDEFYFDVKIKGLDPGLELKEAGFLFSGDELKNMTDRLNGTAQTYQIVYLEFQQEPILTEVDLETAIANSLSLTLWNNGEDEKLQLSSVLIPEVYQENKTLAFNITSKDSNLIKGQKVKFDVSQTYSFITKDSEGVFYGLSSSELEIELDTWRTRKAQRQYEKEVSYNNTEQQAEEQAKVIGAVTGNTSTTAVASVTIASILMGLSLSFLWGLINTIQMFEFFSLPQVKIPNFVIKILAQFTISQFDQVPYKEQIEKSFKAPDGDTVFRDNFSETDIFSRNFIFNTKEISIILYLMLLAMLFFAVADKIFVCKGCQKEDGFFKKYLKNFKYNAFLRFGVEAYLPAIASAFVTIRTGSTATPFSMLSMILAYCATILLVYLLVFCTFIVTVRYNLLLTPKYKEKFGSLYLEQKTESKVAILYHTFFMLQRLYLAAVIVFATSIPLYQVHSIFWTQFMMFAYVCKVKPHKEKLSNYLQIFNDGCLLIVATLLFAFYYLDEYSREKFWIGWLFISVMLVNVTVNIVLAFILAIRNCCQKRKKKKVDFLDDPNDRKETEENQEIKKEIKGTANKTTKEIAGYKKKRSIEKRSQTFVIEDETEKIKIQAPISEMRRSTVMGNKDKNVDLAYIQKFLVSEPNRTENQTVETKQDMLKTGRAMFDEGSTKNQIEDHPESPKPKEIINHGASQRKIDLALSKNPSFDQYAIKEKVDQNNRAKSILKERPQKGYDVLQESSDSSNKKVRPQPKQYQDEDAEYMTRKANPKETQ